MLGKENKENELKTAMVSGEKVSNSVSLRIIRQHESLDRETKKKIRKNISNWNVVSSIISNYSPEQLIEVQSLLWNEAMAYAENVLHQKLAREFITARIEPTANYHRRQMCAEPVSACRANYCIHSNPACATKKLNEQIKAIATIFDRRVGRTENPENSLEDYLQNLILRFGLFAIIVTTEDGVPVAAASDLKNLDDCNHHSELVKFFYKHLERYIKDEKNEGSVYYDVSFQALSHKIAHGDQKFIITMLAIKTANLNVAMFQSLLGINRIYFKQQNSENY